MTEKKIPYDFDLAQEFYYAFRKYKDSNRRLTPSKLIIPSEVHKHKIFKIFNIGEHSNSFFGLSIEIDETINRLKVA